MHIACTADARFVSARDVIHDTIEEFNVDSTGPVVGLSAMSLRGHVNAVDVLEHCITDVNQWMTANRLISSIRRRRNFCGLVPDIPCAN